MNHIWNRLELPASEWRKIYKSLHLLDTILKAGDPECVGEIKANSFKLKVLENFSFYEQGSDRGTGISDKAESINKLLNDPEQLSEERDKAKKIRGKVFGEGLSGSGDKKGRMYFLEESGYDPESKYESPKESPKKNQLLERGGDLAGGVQESGKKLSKKQEMKKHSRPENEWEDHEPDSEDLKPEKTKSSKRKEKKVPKEEKKAAAAREEKKVAETFDLLQLAEDVPEQKTKVPNNSQDLLQIFGTGPPQQTNSKPAVAPFVEDVLFLNPSPPAVNTKPIVQSQLCII